MEQRKVFLEKNRSVSSSNAESFINVELSAKTRLLPFNGLTDKLSLFKLYNNERDTCERFRMIFTINPICSNVLFNTRTEVVKNEGSDNCVLLLGDKKGNKGRAKNSTDLDWKQALRDTEYSHPSLYDDGQPFVYHCGWDIFNNHMLRNDDFTYVSKRTSVDPNFNTILDKIRDYKGEVVKENIGGKTIDRHLYQFDNILTIYDTFANRVKEKDGWYGFTNPGNIEIPNLDVNGKYISVNKLMNGNKACEFMDFYPDRSLYSFIPKVNKFRGRLEKNWDYCITYPYKKDVAMFKTVMKNNSGAIQIVEAKVTYSNTGSEVVLFKSSIRHTLQKGDNITLYYSVDGKEQKYPVKVQVIAVGDAEGNGLDRYFVIKATDIAQHFKIEGGELKYRPSAAEGTSTAKVDFFYKKTVSNYECQYYFRKFKKLTNDGRELKSEINKLAYGENIYGDRVAQIVFTDDVDVTGLVDHNGRPLTEIYLTFIKTNRGHNTWYNEEITSGANIEFSHCFGDITSGIDMPEDDNCKDYNVRRLHNVDYDTLSDNKYGEQNKKIFKHLANKPTPIESGITLDREEFYGDIVEYDVFNVKETVIETVNHRFNTAQRETSNIKFADVLYDRLDNDDYDTDVNKSALGGFKVTSGYINARNSFEEIENIDKTKMFNGNINPEGYYYCPHYKVQIREEATTITQVNARVIPYQTPLIGDIFENAPYLMDGRILNDEDGNPVLCNKVIIRTFKSKNFIKLDPISFYDKETENIIWGFIESVVTDDERVTLTIAMEGKLNPIKWVNRGYIVATTDEGVAAFAKFLPNGNKFIWREVVAPSELEQNSELYDMPFTNGRLYIHKNINFFLKRQDPRNEYGLLIPEPEGEINPLSSYKIWGYDNIDISPIKYQSNWSSNICI